ncbi:cobalamin B12-binding domain-containing protein [Pseudaestuariivita sp.]|uniref:cobalamin B12-binding domain-containing protein n=1 Tax=Pseudaestuariivita sp. TaxID=2211669 RepID=UPI0040583D0F
MSKDLPRQKTAWAPAPRPGVSALAAQALSVVRPKAKSQSRGIDQDIVDDLRRMVLASPTLAAEEIVSTLRDAGISDASIVDDFIPTVARTLGDCWLSDELPFAQVSIGAARLQGLLPLLDDSASPHAAAPCGVALLLVTEADDHTLGAFVLAHQLRRVGIDIHVVVGARPDEVASLVQQGGFDVVMISCSQASALETIEELVDKVRQSCDAVPPILLGGGGVSGIEGLEQKTGVDRVLTGFEDMLNLISELSAGPAGRA